MVEETKDPPEMTEQEAGKLAMDALTSDSTEEAETEATEEVEQTEETTETTDSKDSEATEETTETETEEVTEEVAQDSVFNDLKAQVGRVSGIQKDTAQNKSEIAQLREMFKEMLTPKPQQEAEGLIDSLTSEDGEAKLDDRIKDVVKNLYGAEIEAQKQTRERMDYYQKLQNLSGENWDAIEPAATQVVAEIAEAKEKGEPWAQEVMRAIENPLTLKLLAEKHISMNAGEQAAALKGKRQQTAKSVSGQDATVAPEAKSVTREDILKMSPKEAEKNLAALLKGDAKDFLQKGFELG